jgi:hypothetical protein
MPQNHGIVCYGNQAEAPALARVAAATNKANAPSSLGPVGEMIRGFNLLNRCY